MNYFATMKFQLREAINGKNPVKVGIVPTGGGKGDLKIGSPKLNPVNKIFPAFRSEKEGEGSKFSHNLVSNSNFLGEGVGGKVSRNNSNYERFFFH